MRTWIPPRVSACVVAAVALVLPSCEPGGHFTILGYTTQPNYNSEIHTVRVPMFGNDTFYRGMEVQLTEAVIRKIESQTPYKVVPGGCAADTELVGKIVTYNKNLINATQLNGVRESEATLAVEVTWRDLRQGRTGDIMFALLPRPAGTELITAPIPPTPAPVLVQSLATIYPELGVSLASAQQKNVDSLAVQIVSMMEKSWR